ncbi:helix-turn-helix domain-containing protein [Nocardia brasiliensis]|uniref:helix-turn-helix domain-containing protein n=1 Tax=Nocardia brasiliensis TaxID=37326 RepID=UPI003795F16C
MKTSQTWAEEVTARVRTAIDDAGKTGLQVSIETGIPDATLSRKLRALYPLSLTDIEKIADVLGVTPDEFMPPKQVRAAS